MRVSWPFVGGLLLAAGAIASLVWLGTAFDGVVLPYYGPDAECVFIPAGDRAEITSVADRPLNALSVTAVASALLFGIAIGRTLPAAARRALIVALLLAAAISVLLSRTAYAADNIEVLGVTAAGIGGSIVIWFVLRSFRPSRGAGWRRRFVAAGTLATVLLVGLPLVVFALSQTGARTLCMS